MNQKNNYMYLVLEERNGEYEYSHRSVHKLPDSKDSTMTKYAEDYLKTFYGTGGEKSDEGYYFFEGEAFVRISLYQLIDEKEYIVLNRYL